MQYNGGTQFTFSGTGTWRFRPNSATVGVRHDDEEYMYFGWWSRQNLNPDLSGANPTVWSFHPFHGGSDNSPDTVVGDVNGTYTYRGPAAGYYSIYEPVGRTPSGHGAFSARATLTADFDNSQVHGTIDQFAGHSDWSLTLEQGDISSGAIDEDAVGADSATWSIGGVNNTKSGSGGWEAHFYSNHEVVVGNTLPVGVIPSGIAGTFSARYDDVGRLIGAFGAECVEAACRP